MTFALSEKITFSINYGFINDYFMKSETPWISIKTQLTVVACAKINYSNLIASGNAAD